MIIQNILEHSANSTTNANVPQEKDRDLSGTSADQLARSDRESAIESWLDTHSTPDGWKLAQTFMK